jgi:ligand-binding sensor domain-containing protein/signal transduction histidine kinase
MLSPDAFPKSLRTAIFFLLVIFSGAAFAENGDDWSRRVWQLDEGLPSANVTGIAQTHDGYLWLATQTGLTRFDGMEFSSIPVPIGRPHPFILTMLLDHAENFWLAEREGGSVVVRFGHGAPRMFTEADGLPDAQPVQMLEASDRAIWICFNDGSVCRIAPDDHVAHITATNGLPDDGTCSLTLDAQGSLWFAKGTQYGCWRENHFEKVGELKDRNPLILGVRNGGLWFCTSTQILRSVSNAPPVAVAALQGQADHLRPSAMFEDFNGRLWVGTVSEGLFQLEHTNFFKVDTSQNRIRTIFRDREGSLWVGTDGGGLNRIFPKAVELRGRDEGLPFETVRSLAEDRKGDLWVVTQDGALTRLPGGNWASGQPVTDWPGGIAHNVVMDQQGAMWLGTYRRGLLHWQDGKFSRLGPLAGLAGTTIRSLMVDRKNDLWIGLENEPTVQRLHNGQLQSFLQPTNSRAVRAMAEDAKGQIWFGTLDGRLLRADGDKLAEIPDATTEPAHPIRCLGATADGSLWIGYATYGVCRLKDGKVSHIGPEDGLFDGNICSLMPDTYGRMWFASDRGIFFVSLDQLNKFADEKILRVQSIFYGRDAGLPSVQAYYGYWPGALATSAGDILFPTHSGIAVVHPDHVRGNATPPNVLIQDFAVDGKNILWQSNATAELPPNHRKIEISFTAPSFIAPEQIRFRHRLTGWSDDWSEENRNRTVIFSRLPPGNYTFQVTACNNNGVWNETGASFKFTVAPFFWQSWIFRTLVMLLLLAVIVGTVRHFMLRHVRELVQRVEQEAALQKERTRIAQDMHDELGARFTQISLLGELSAGVITEPDKARDFLGQISRVARSGVKSLDEIVWAVNPRNDTLSDLLDYTGQYARDFLAAANIECRLDFPDPLPEAKVSGEIRHSVFLIVKETLNNTVKHAQAARVKIIFELRSGVMRWQIEDDGKGFAIAPDNALADGLRNIRHRAAALTGSANIESFPGKGTRVTMEIPLPKS